VLCNLLWQGIASQEIEPWTSLLSLIMAEAGESKMQHGQLDKNDAEKTRNSSVQALARQYSDNTQSGVQPVFGSNDPESPLNPRGEHFNARMWAKNLANVAQEHGQRYRQVGLCFQDVNVFGYGTPTDFQKNVGNIWLALPGMARRLFAPTAGQTRIDILRQFDGLIRPGEMCVVLGPPGSGCSTFLKTISGHTNGLHVNPSSYFNYQGISAKEMNTSHRGDYIYTAEVDVHFPMLTVGETLTFASRARCQQELPLGMSRNEYVTMAHY
jgi:ATP-binding cassette subfamily G (WHITE) protein 2 (PDR)